MKRLVAIVLVLALVCVAACAKETTPPDTSPSVSDSETPGIVETTPPTTPVREETFSFEWNEVGLKIDLPISWQDRMEISQDGVLLALTPPPEDYGIPEDLAYIFMEYVDEPDVFGDTFEKATSKESLIDMLVLSEGRGDKLIERTPLNMMDRNALKVTYSMKSLEEPEEVYRAYLIDDGNGCFYIIKFIIEKEGCDGLATFASEAEEAVKSLAFY